MRKEGWYWCRAVGLSQWQALQWLIESDKESYWTDAGGDGFYTVTQVGPRIPTPDEPWQCVPKQATPEMLDCIHDWTLHTEERYAALLEMAPKPEETPNE